MSRHERREPTDLVTPPDGNPGVDSETTERIAAIYGDGALAQPFGAEPPAEPAAPAAAGGGAPAEAAPEPDPLPGRPKIKWLRLVALLSGLGLLAAVSTVFGMMMAVASDLPEVEALDVAQRSSKIVDRHGRDLGVLTGNENRILVRSDEIAPVMKHAIVAIEDRRFYTNSGVDLRGIGRALWQDIRAQRAVQGGSTITQQLVKNRLEAQDDRTLFQKLREAAMAFHMTRKWDKERILRNYLNTIYFGNGAYGVESAARTYFGAEYGVGTEQPLCGSANGQRRCAEMLEPQEAALLAGIVASPSMYDPIANPSAAKARRDLVLTRMLEQGYITQPQYEAAVQEPVPTREDIRPPEETSRYPYFTTWVRQQVVDKVGAGRAFEGGLTVRTTLDSKLQDAAQESVNQLTQSSPDAPAAALVALDNDTSEVLAMVGGSEGGYNERPFNLATQGQRQPGSAFKPFTLAAALSEGISPNSTWASQKRSFCVVRRKGRCIEHFEVNNYEDAYSGVTTLANATAFSDNSVYAELGIKVGTKKIARLARRMGVRTPVSSNYAITLGGLREGVTVMDMAHAYETFANRGRLTYGTLSPGAESYERDKGTVPGPVGIRQILEPRQGKLRTAELLNGERAANRTERDRVISEGVATQVESMLQGVVRYGSGRRASLGPEIMAAGKTGTTEDYGDAWFVGWTPRYTVAVWVGYPDSVRPMKPPTFSFIDGEPVAGGTWPATIWQSFMKRAFTIYPLKRDDDELAPTTAPVESAPAPAGGTATPAPPGGGAPSAEEAPAQQPDRPSPPQQPQQQQSTPPQQQQPETVPDNGGGAAPEGGAAPPPGE
ncbi:MAG TPA: transglycosylase domain-containing protein [Solirubrobacteraceae bacterium]|nr:transglycosylase domain-containing protein [Solirubrobacteraceae bacterium]